MARQINNGPFLANDDGKKFIGWTNPDDTETFIQTGNYRHAFPFTSEGIRSAISSIWSTGKPGLVILADVDYAVDSDIQLLPGVSVKGQGGLITLVGDIPDQNFTITGGTRLILSPGVTGFVWNNIDKVSEETNIAENAITDSCIDGIAFIGGKRAIDIGAYNAMGAMRCSFTNLYGMEQTDDYAFDFKNFQHCWFDQIYASTQLDSGSGIRFASMLSSTLYPGNSEFGEIYTFCKNRKNKPITFEASGPAGCILNQLKVYGRLQGNRYGAASPDVISFTTNGTANITVPDASVFQLGSPIVFASTAPTNFTVGVVYFVKTLNTSTNVITLCEDPWGAAITAGSSSSYNASYSGWPSIMFTASNSANSIKNSDFGQLDCEAFGNVAALIVGKTRNCKAFLSEIMTSSTSTALVCRDAEISLETSGINVTQDQSSNFGFSSVWCAPKPYQYNGAGFTLDNTWNGRRVRYTGTADITITVPNTLPKGFVFEITPTGATGIVTFAAAAGGAVFSFGSKLRTAGQYATAKLAVIANKVSSLSGDLQV